MMIKIRVSPTVSPFQVDFPVKYKVKSKNGKEVDKRVEKRSVKDKGSINFRPGVVKLITDDEWEYLKSKREELIGPSLLLLEEVKDVPKKGKKGEGPKAESVGDFGSGGKKDKDSKKKNR